MNLTTEQRQLLDGDEARAQRNLPLLGWGDATGAPDWVKTRVLEIRSAIVEKRSIPAPSHDYVAGAERRSAALGFSQRLFPALNEDLRTKAVRLGAQIKADYIIAAANQILLKEARERAFQNNESPEGFRRRLERIDQRAGGGLEVQSPGLDARPGSTPDTDAIRCVGGSFSASREDHLKAADAHRNLAKRCSGQYGAARADAHYAAAYEHDLVADTDENDPDYADRCARAVARCQRSSLFTESA
jgi:hypothetical protein